MSTSILRIHPLDNVAVAVTALVKGSRSRLAGTEIVAEDDIPSGHKIALRALHPGDNLVKFGHFIGCANAPVRLGSWVHTHNLVTGLGDAVEYEYQPVPRNRARPPSRIPLFQGYRRRNRKVGTRNEIWVLNTVGCVNKSAERIARICNEQFKGCAFLDGVFSFAHPYGCSQLGDDLENTRQVLAGLLRHPNAGGVLVLGLGCENNQMQELLEVAGDVDRTRIRFFNSQDVLDEVEQGVAMVEELVDQMRQDQRSSCPCSDLVIGLKCGGSDGFSGITANPLLGRLTDRITAFGGRAILTEVPEMFGAEQQLMNRAKDEEVYHQIVSMINDFKNYFIQHGQPIYENPSPGNLEGGITTLEEKSLGATQKGGSSLVTQVLDYGEPVSERGLALLKAPGNDAVSTTAQVASGATVLFFTTGRGTPLGLPVPTVKISSNSQIFLKKPQWIDFNAGKLIEGAATLETLTDALLALTLSVASGETKTMNEISDYREIAIWKDGVTL